MKYLKAFLIVSAFTALDLWTKAWMSAHFVRGQSKVIIPKMFNLTLVHNRGAAFGVGTNWPGWFFVLVTLFMLGFLVYVYWGLQANQRWSRWGVLLILSGAIGNLVDRIRFGYVVDFLDVYYGKHHWPAFNIADAAILIGAVFCFIDMSRSKSK